jgi:hypothetical protein
MTGTSDLPDDVTAPSRQQRSGDTMRMLEAFLALSGCAPIEESPRTAIGAGSGVAGGARGPPA